MIRTEDGGTGESLEDREVSMSVSALSLTCSSVSLSHSGHDSPSLVSTLPALLLLSVEQLAMALSLVSVLSDILLVMTPLLLACTSLDTDHRSMSLVSVLSDLPLGTASVVALGAEI